MRNVVIALVLLVAAVIGVRHHLLNEAEKERLLATNTAAVISVSFSQAEVLTVYRAKGILLASTGDTNTVGIPSTQTTRAPFTVDYQIDMARITDGNYRWESGTRTMFVTLPDVSVAPPNIDWQRAQVKQGGFWISREAGQRLQKRAATQLVNGARNEANKPENLEAARRSAVEKTMNRTLAPLKAAGLSNVRVIARFASDRTTGRSWDVSRSLREVYADK